MGDLFYFKAYYHYLEDLADLDDTQVGRIFRAALRYAIDGTMDPLDLLERVAFRPIKRDIDNSQSDFISKCATNKKNGSKGGRPKKPNGFSENQENRTVFEETEKSERFSDEPDETDGFLEKPKEPNIKNKDKDKEQEEIISISNEIDSASDGAGRTPCKKIMELFNKTCTSLPQIKSIEGQRRVHVTTHWRKHQSLDFFEDLFKKAEESDFLTGRTGQWKANFDWIIKPSNVTKIMEGNYINKTAPKKEFEQSSFDADDYMLSALKRTYGTEEKEETEENNG